LLTGICVRFSAIVFVSLQPFKMMDKYTANQAKPG